MEYDSPGIVLIVKAEESALVCHFSGLRLLVCHLSKFGLPKNHCIARLRPSPKRLLSHKLLRNEMVLSKNYWQPVRPIPGVFSWSHW